MKSVTKTVLGIRKDHFWILIITWFIVHILLFEHYGIRKLLDANGYILGADFLLANGTLIDIHHAFYITLVGLIALFRLLFPNEILPYLIFQCVLSAVAVLALYKSSARIFNNSLAGLCSGIIFLVWWDNIHWNTVTMSESLAVSVSCFVIFYLTRFRGLLKDYIRIVVLLIIAFFIRPTGIIIILGSVAFFLMYHWHYIQNRAVLKFYLIIVLLVLSFLSAYLMFTHWDFTAQYKKGNIVTYMDRLEGSSLYAEDLRIKPHHVKFADENKSTAIKIVYFIFYNPVYFIKTASLKVWYLLTFVRPYYTAWHNLYSVFWVGFIYLMFYFGWRKATDTPVKFFTATVIVVNCWLIAIATVDWDNRFYIPMEPGIVLMAGGGLFFILGKMKKENGIF